MKKLILTLLTCTLLLSANASTFLFSGSGNWNSVSNWSPAFPTYSSGDTILIQGNCSIPSGFQVNIPSANITFQIEGSLTVNDSLTFPNFLTVLPNAQLINNDTILVKYIAQSNGIINQGTLINNASIEIEDETDGTLINSGSITNNGSMISAGIFQNLSNIENHGTAGVSSLGLFTNSGSISGDGNLLFVINQGIITPGNSTLASTILLSNSSADTFSIFNMNITNATTFDKIQLNGFGLFAPNGILNISTNSGFTPSLGQRYKLFTSLTPGLLNSSFFSAVNFPPAPTGTAWLINYYADSIVVYLDFTLSEPSLIQFHATKKFTTSVLNWNASSEVFDSFEIERANSSFIFESIGSIGVNQSGEVIQDFHFTDMNPFQGENYYRLKMHTHQHEIMYSSMAILNFDKQETEILNTIIDHDLKISSLINQSIFIYNLNGQLVLSTNIPQGISSISFLKLASGRYFVRCEDKVVPVLKR